MKPRLWRWMLRSPLTPTNNDAAAQWGLGIGDGSSGDKRSADRGIGWSSIKLTNLDRILVLVVVFHVKVSMFCYNENTCRGEKHLNLMGFDQTLPPTNSPLFFGAFPAW